MSAAIRTGHGWAVAVRLPSFCVP